MTITDPVSDLIGWSVTEGSATVTDAESVETSGQSVVLASGSTVSEALRTVQGAEWGSETVAWWDVWLLPVAHSETSPTYTLGIDGAWVEFRGVDVVFDQAALLSYGTYYSQDGQNSSSTTATVSNGGADIRLEGNAWKALPYEYTVTEDTWLKFEVSISDVGEFTGIAFDDDLDEINEVNSFQLAGSDVWSAGYDDYTYTGPGFETFTIPLGQFFTGTVAYLALFADDDANASSDVTFRNIQLYEGALPSGENGEFVIADGTARLALPQYFAATSGEADAWQRLTMRHDYTTGSWDLFINGASVPSAANLGLYSAPTEPTSVVLLGDTSSAVYFDQLALSETNPLFTDVDNDGMADSWEANFNGTSTATNDRDADPDMDTYTNLEEYLAATSPDDYYNDAQPTLTMVSGDGQVAYPGIWLEAPLVVNVKDGASNDLENAPIEWSHPSDTDSLSEAYKSVTVESPVQIRTDANGESTVYVKVPNSPEDFDIQATAYAGASQVAETFEFAVNLLRFKYDAEDGTPGDDLINDYAPSSEGSNNFYTRGAHTTIYATDYIPIDPDKQYRLTGLMRSSGAQLSKIFFGFTCYRKNSQGNFSQITSWHVNRGGSTATIVSYDPQSPNAIITLDSAPTGWSTSGSNWQSLGYYIGGDTDKLPILQHGPGLTEAYDSINGNQLILASGVTLPSAVIDALNASETVVVKNHRPSGHHNYAAANNELVPNQWREYAAESITGMSWSSTPYNEFWTGAEYVRLSAIVNFQNANASIDIDDLIFEEITDYDGDLIPDWWERQILEANDADGLVVIEDVGSASDFDGDGLTDDQEYANGNNPLVADYISGASGVYYVDNMRGSNSGKNGLSATNGVPSASYGPFETVTKAITTASSSNHIVVYETRNKYAETTLNLTGKDLVLKPVGSVSIATQ